MIEMSESVPPSIPSAPQIEPPQITPEQLEMMKRMAKERAIQQIAEQQRMAGTPPANPMVQPPVMQQPSAPQPQVVYVRRPLTVAEIIIVFVISCGIVTGGQLIWQGLTNFLPRVEIRMK